MGEKKQQKTPKGDIRNTSNNKNTFLKSQLLNLDSFYSSKYWNLIAFCLLISKFENG